MREFARPAATALSVACLAAAMAVVSSSGALAQAKAAPPAPQQNMDAITAKLPDNAKPDPKIIAQLDAVAKKNGFAGYDEYNNVIDNIGIVLAGFDPVTKKYVGTEAVIKAQMAQVQADKKMSAKDKKDTLDELTQALK